MNFKIVTTTMYNNNLCYCFLIFPDANTKAPIVTGEQKLHLTMNF